MNDLPYLGFLIGTILPLLVGLVTTRLTNPGLKAVLLAFLSAVTGFLTELATPDFELRAALLTWLGTFLVAVGTHYGFWKPVGAASRLQAIGAQKDYDRAA